MITPWSHLSVEFKKCSHMDPSTNCQDQLWLIGGNWWSSVFDKEITMKKNTNRTETTGSKTKHKNSYGQKLVVEDGLFGDNAVKMTQSFLFQLWEGTSNKTWWYKLSLHLSICNANALLHRSGIKGTKNPKCWRMLKIWSSGQKLPSGTSNNRTCPVIHCPFR